MYFSSITVGPLEVNCCFLGDDATRHVFVIDPGDNPEKIRGHMAAEHLVPAGIITTHGHVDHAGAVAELKTEWNVPYMIHAEDLPLLNALPVQSSQFGLYLSGIPKPDRLLEDGEILVLGDIRATVIHTPGHSPGSICLLVNDLLLSGDTLFRYSVGRTDLPGGSGTALMVSLKEKLMGLDDNVRVIPGHGPGTTIGDERRHNPFIRHGF